MQRFQGKDSHGKTLVDPHTECAMHEIFSSIEKLGNDPLIICLLMPSGKLNLSISYCIGSCNMNELE